jgi:hypothetical protein
MAERRLRGQSTRQGALFGSEAEHQRTDAKDAAEWSRVQLERVSPRVIFRDHAVLRGFAVAAASVPAWRGTVRAGGWRTYWPINVFNRLMRPCNCVAKSLHSG